MEPRKLKNLLKALRESGVVEYEYSNDSDAVRIVLAPGQEPEERHRVEKELTREQVEFWSSTP